MPNVWIVSVNYNGLEDTRKCLRSLQAVADPRPSVVVVDNASNDDPTPSLRDEFPWAHLVRNPVNGGWAGGNNTGIVYALERGAAQVVLLNNDTIVTPDFPQRLLAAAAAHPDFGVIGPVINYMDDPGEVMTDGCIFNRPGGQGFFQRRPVPLMRADPPALTEVDIVNGCCMMVSRAVFDRIGLIDERFFLIHEESDFCLRARQAGFRCGVMGETLVWHKGSSSFKRSGKRWQRYYDARNLSLLLRKHQATHRPGRGAWRSRLEYVKYVYYRYSVEREEGSPDSASAVLEGFCDALACRFGPYAPAPARPLPIVRSLFELWRHWRVRHGANKTMSGTDAGHRPTEATVPHLR
jgi:GT2 family glycosyltransferase